MVAKARRKLNEDSDAAPLVAPVKNSHHSTTTDHKGESSNRASQIQIQRSTPPMQPSLFGTPLPPLVSHADNSNKIDIASGNTSGIHSGGIGGIGSSTTTDFFRAFGSSSKPSLNASAGFYGTKSKSKKKKKNSTSKKASNMDTADDIRSENVAVNSNVGGNIGNSTINAGQPEAQGLKRTSSDVLPKHSLPLPKAPPRVMRGNAAVRAKNGASTTESVNTTSSQLSRSSSESKSIGSSINPNVISRSSRYNTVQEESDEADSDDSFEADLAEENEDSKEMLAAELAYEEQLQRDYVNLKAQFDEKLQLAENMHSQDDQNESIPGTALLTEAVTVADPNTIPRVYSSQYDNKLTPAQLLAQWANEDAMVVEGEEEHDYQEEREGESIGEDDDASYQCKAGSEVESESQLELRMRACNNSMKATIFDEDSEEEDEMALIRSTRNKTRNVSMEHKRDLVDNSVVAAMVGAATMENVGIGGLTLHDDECEKMLQQLHSKITNR